jgi:hypothetical protein
VSKQRKYEVDGPDAVIGVPSGSVGVTKVTVEQCSLVGGDRLAEVEVAMALLPHPPSARTDAATTPGSLTRVTVLPRKR